MSSLLLLMLTFATCIHAVRACAGTGVWMAYEGECGSAVPTPSPHADGGGITIIDGGAATISNGDADGGADMAIAGKSVSTPSLSSNVDSDALPTIDGGDVTPLAETPAGEFRVGHAVVAAFGTRTRQHIAST